MTAITITDLSNAKLDADHLGDLLTSASPTATDRLGHTKRTWAGLLADADAAVADAIVEVTDARDAAQAAASGALASEVNAGNYAAAAAAAGVAGVYSTVALGIAGTSAGQHFDVTPVAGLFHYRYLRVGASDAQFVGMVALTPAAQAVRDAQIAAKSPYLVPALPASVTNFWDSATAQKWDGRLLENVVSNVLPTLNLLPDPFVMLDEDGGTTPTRSIFDATVTDPLGTTKANVIGWVAQVTPLTTYVRANSPGLPVDDYTTQIKVKQADATTGTARIGAASNVAGEANTAALTGAWQTLAKTNTAYGPASTFELGFTNNVGGGTVNVAAFNLQMFDKKAGTILPTDAQEMAASVAGHMKTPVSYAGAITLDSYGWIKPSGNFENLVAAFLQQNVSALSFGAMVDVQSNPASSYAHLFGVATHAAAGITAASRGQLGITQGTYRLYCNPALAAANGKSLTVLLNQGPVSLILTVKNSRCIAYINGVPQFEDTTSSSVTSWAAFLLERMLAFKYDGLKKRHQAGNALADPANFFFAAPAFLSQAEVTAVDAHMRGRAHVTGKPPGVRKICVIPCGDSLTAFTQGPTWKASENALLRPGVHFSGLDAVGGSKYVVGALAGSNSYNDPSRQAWRRTLISAALAADYDEVIVQWQYGTNDVTGGVMDTAGWATGVATIDGMIFADKAACDDGSGRLKTAIVTPPANASASVDRQGYLDAYSAATRTDYASRGYDYLIDLAAYVPAGWASLYAASLDAFTTGLDNNVYLNGGIHWSDTGGANAAAAVHVPFYRAIADGLVGTV